MAIIFPESTLTIARNKLGAYLDYRLANEGLPILGQSWFDPSESEANHRDLSGNIFINGEPNEFTKQSSAMILPNYTVIARVEITISAESSYLNNQQPTNALEWLLSAMSELSWTGAITGDGQSRVIECAGGRIRNFGRNEDRLNQLNGQTFIDSSVFVEYVYPKFGIKLEVR